MEHSAAAAELATDMSAITSAASDLPHLAPALSVAVSLNPGDLILHHPALPIQAPAQAFLPLTLLPNISTNADYVTAQRAAYEKGLPPPAEVAADAVTEAKGRGVKGGRAVRVEKTSGEQGVSGWRGKKVMGY